METTNSFKKNRFLLLVISIGVLAELLLFLHLKYASNFIFYFTLAISGIAGFLVLLLAVLLLNDRIKSTFTRFLSYFVTFSAVSVFTFSQYSKKLGDLIEESEETFIAILLIIIFLSMIYLAVKSWKRTKV